MLFIGHTWRTPHTVHLPSGALLTPCAMCGYRCGARYDRTRRCLQPPRPKQMADPLPPIHFEPACAAQELGGASTADDEAPTATADGGEGEEEGEGEERDSFYECPLYKTSARAGTLSTTGDCLLLSVTVCYCLTGTLSTTGTSTNFVIALHVCYCLLLSVTQGRPPTL